MAKSYFAWWEVNDHFFQIKFVSTIDVDSFVNANFVLYNDSASPTAIVEPFRDIVVAKDYSSISRILTLWWKNPPPSGAHTLHVNNLKTFLGEDVGDFSIPFNWVLDPATPESGSTGELLQPSREPVEVEDYSIKTPGWSILESPTVVSDATTELSIVDIAPGSSQQFRLEANENRGRIDILFSHAIYSNFLSSAYFALQKKSISSGIQTWEYVDTSIQVSLDAMMVSLYLPVVGATTTTFSFMQTQEEIDLSTYFESQSKYKLILSPEIGAVN